MGEPGLQKLKGVPFFENGTCIGLYTGVGRNDVPWGDGVLQLAAGGFWKGFFVRGKRSGDGIYKSATTCYLETVIGDAVTRRVPTGDFKEPYPWVFRGQVVVSKFPESVCRTLRKLKGASSVFTTKEDVGSKLATFKRRIQKLTKQCSDNVIAIVKCSHGYFALGEGGISVTDKKAPTVWYCNWEGFYNNCEMSGKYLRLDGKVIQLDASLAKLMVVLVPKLKAKLKKYWPEISNLKALSTSSSQKTAETNLEEPRQPPAPAEPVQPVHLVKSLPAQVSVAEAPLPSVFPNSVGSVQVPVAQPPPSAPPSSVGADRGIPPVRSGNAQSAVPRGPQPPSLHKSWAPAPSPSSSAIPGHQRLNPVHSSSCPSGLRVKPSTSNVVARSYLPDSGYNRLQLAISYFPSTSRGSSNTSGSIWSSEGYLQAVVNGRSEATDESIALMSLDIFALNA